MSRRALIRVWNLLAAFCVLITTQAALAKPVRPRDVSVHGQEIDWLVDFAVFWVIALFVLMAAWLIAAVILHRDKKHDAVFDRGNHRRGLLMACGVAAFVFFAGSAEARMVAAEQSKSNWRAQFARTFNNAKTYTTRRAGDSIHVIWDETERRYRYATST